MVAGALSGKVCDSGIFEADDEEDKENRDPSKGKIVKTKEYTLYFKIKSDTRETKWAPKWYAMETDIFQKDF